jgi:hypothetical protein
MKGKATLESVAKLAQVSPATVSRVINRIGRVGPEVEKHVRSAGPSWLPFCWPTVPCCIPFTPKSWWRLQARLDLWARERPRTRPPE